VKIDFVDEARSELIEAALWYEHQEPGLGTKFRDEISSLCDKISCFPYLWRELEGGYRRVNCPVFPYFIAYRVIRQSILVFAVAHAHREPNYWKNRKG
jgi:plasmid stabilization system protein ParE